MKRILLMLVFSAATAFGQTEDQETRVTLNIGIKEIRQPHYIASKAVHLSSADGTLRIEAGAVVEAQEVRITLRQVRGEVTFKASVARLREVLDRFESGRRSP